MATTFDTATYPLQAATGFAFELGSALDIMDDKTPRLRTVSSTHHASVTCVFQPMDSSTSTAFLTYITDNSAVEFDITHHSKTYRGYIQPGSPQKEIDNAPLTIWSFEFYAKLV